jgi:hypothetical protein
MSDYLSPLRRAVCSSSLSWPPYWRGTVNCVWVAWDVVSGQEVVNVLPVNPEYRKYLDSGTEFADGVVRHWNKPPPETLPPIVFDSLEDMDNWARMVYRMDK